MSAITRGVKAARKFVCKNRNRFIVAIEKKLARRRYRKATKIAIRTGREIDERPRFTERDIV